MKTELTLGYIRVYIPLYDCEGCQRSIDFAITGRCLSGNSIYHWSAKPYYKKALSAAKKAIKALEKVK